MADDTKTTPEPIVEEVKTPDTGDKEATGNDTVAPIETKQPEPADLPSVDVPQVVDAQPIEQPDPEPAKTEAVKQEVDVAKVEEEKKQELEENLKQEEAKPTVEESSEVETEPAPENVDDSEKEAGDEPVTAGEPADTEDKEAPEEPQVIKPYTVRSEETGDKVYVVRDNKRYWIKNPPTLTKLGFNLGQEKSIPFSEMLQIPEGAPIDLTIPGAEAPWDLPEGEQGVINTPSTESQPDDQDTPEDPSKPYKIWS